MSNGDRETQHQTTILEGICMEPYSESEIRRIHKAHKSIDKLSQHKRLDILLRMYEE